MKKKIEYPLPLGSILCQRRLSYLYTTSMKTMQHLYYVHEGHTTSILRPRIPSPTSICHRLDLDCKRSKKGMLLFHYVIYSPLSLWFPFPFIFLIPPYYYTNTNCMYRYIYVTSPICMSTSMPQCTCHIAVQQRSSRLRCTALTL